MTNDHESKPEPEKPESKPETPKPESKPEPKPETPKSQSKPEPNPEAPKPESKPESTPEPKRSKGSLRSKVRWTKRIIIVALLILLVLLLLNWKYCKRGAGSGGLEAADGTSTDSMSGQMTSSSRKATKPLGAVCRLRVDKKGITHKGKPIRIPEAVKACRGAKRAELAVTGDATFGTVKQLEQGLRAAGITVVRR